jgi:membrane protease YdiL (CAAX protease family)
VSSSSSDRAAALRGFGPAGIASMVVVLAGNFLFAPLSAVLALLWAALSRTPWREIGYARPRSWARTIVFGVAFGAAFKVLMKTIVMPLLGAPAVNARYHFLAHNTALLPAAVLAMIVVAGFGEETVFRGYLFERLRKLLGARRGATVAIVLVTSAWFALAHYPDQGLPGVEQAIFTGLVFGSIFAFTGVIWFVICAHAAFDLAALAMIYFDVEPAFAHFFWK